VPDHRPSLGGGHALNRILCQGEHGPHRSRVMPTNGLPVVRVGRGNTEGFVPLHDPSFIGGSNLTATKARLLLMACLMRFGSRPPTANPDHPTPEEAAATRKKVAAYQAVFDTH
jgi:L-asparaginase